MSEAVITGVGVVSAFGVGAATLWDGLAAGAHAVGPIRSFDASAFSSQVAGEVPIVDADAGWVQRHSPVSMSGLQAWAEQGWLRDRKIAFGLVAAAEAWQSAGGGVAERDAALSVAFGMEHPFLEDIAALYDGEFFDWRLLPSAGLPFVSFRSPFDGCAQLLVDGLELCGPVTVHASACAGGCLAVSHAAALIRRGEAQVVLCGAADSMLNPMGFGGMCRLHAPSPRNEPDACRPFDRRRDGTVIGEGAAMFVVEEADRARSRGARPLAQILGWGSSQDGYRVSAPRPDGAAAARAISLALTRASLQATDVGYVNAHGTGTLLNDSAEARAMVTALGAHGRNVPVSSIKGAVGHLMAASGALEIAACLLPLTKGVAPATAHCRQPDPDCAISVIGDAPSALETDVVLSNSFGFGGQNAAILLGRCT